jgi:hypothetical protein
MFMADASGGNQGLHHNNGMHPTRNSAALKLNLSGGRVMPGVMLLRRALQH